MKHFPCQAILRNGTRATLHGCAAVGHDRMLTGTHDATGSFDLWLPSARWSYRDCDHPLDVVTMITPGGKHIAINAEPSEERPHGALSTPRTA